RRRRTLLAHLAAQARHRPVLDVGRVEQVLLLRGLDREDLLQVARREVAPMAAAADALAEDVDGDGSAERGRAQHEVAARGELAVRRAARAVTAPCFDAALVKLVNDEF